MNAAPHHAGATDWGPLLAGLVADPSSDALLTLRGLVHAHPSFDPGLVLSEALDGPPGSPVDPAAAPALLRRLQGLMPGALLSASVHLRLADVQRALGRADRADVETRVARAALRAVLASGDGSAEHPWTVLRIADELDVVRRLDRVPVGQELLRVGRRDVDRLECSDGQALHFDVTGLVVASGTSAAR